MLRSTPTREIGGSADRRRSAWRCEIGLSTADEEIHSFQPRFSPVTSVSAPSGSDWKTRMSLRAEKRKPAWTQFQMWRTTSLVESSLEA